MKIRIALLFLVCFVRINAQNLTINSSGETGASGINWSVSGTNPVKITSSNSSNINVSVIQGYINNGVDVIITSIGSIIINSDITKNNSGRLILKSGTNSISGTGKFSLSNNAQLLIGQGVSISNNIELISGDATIGFAPIEIEYLIVAGGGAGGVGRGGGGGAGGVRTGAIEVANETYSITVGAGGAAVTNDQRGNNGSNSSAFNIIATGGGGGGGWVSGLESGANGGSGGGASASPFQAGTGIIGQGNNGFWLNYYREPGGGGGGAGTAANSKDGGLGIVTNITGNSMWIAGGGGAGSMGGGLSLAGVGGIGGGGNGTKVTNGIASSGLTNTGSGGGGSEGYFAISGSGGLGIIVLRYFGSDIASGGIEYAGTNLALGYQVHEFKQIGTDNFSINGNIFQGTISGQISGIGNLILNPSSGIINILGNNTYSGNTTISSGNIQIGNNGINGSLGIGNIVNNGILTVNKSNSLTIVGTISGTGSIIKQGSGTLILTQNNTYSGTTTISAGVLQLGDNTITGIIGAGNIINNSAILVKRSDDLTMSNLISGTGTLTKENSNILTLTQNNTYSGNNTINGGTLVLQNNAPNPTNKTFNGTGKLRIEPASASFTSGYSTLGYTFNSSLSELTLGKVGNLSTITSAIVTSISGPVTIFGGTIAINENIACSNGSTISLFGNTLTFGTNKTVTSNNGLLIIAPQTASNSIGLGGASGTLSLPASYFSTNFADGFSNIQIGSNLQTGNISTNSFTLRDNITFLTSGSLALGGKPILGNNNVTLGSAISSISGMPTHYFQTNGTGSVVRSIANNTNFLFPIGNASYNPVSISNKTGVLDTFSMGILDTAYLNGASSGIIKNPYVKRTWNISKNTASANAGSGVDLTFNWNANEVVGTLTNPTLNHHNGSGWEIPTMGTSSVSGNSLTYTGYKGTFSPFAIGGSSSVGLEVELMYFVAICKSDYIQIDWTTASEINNKVFELYKSVDAKSWDLTYTASGQGDKATETHYSFNDFDKKTTYYRLKDIDEDGIENWSQIIFADCKSEVSGIQIYPNPSSDFIKVIVPISENTILNILSLEGKIIKSMPLISNQTLISVKELTAGIYFVEIKGNHNNSLLKFTKN